MVVNRVERRRLGPRLPVDACPAAFVRLFRFGTIRRPLPPRGPDGHTGGRRAGREEPTQKVRLRTQPGPECMILGGGVVS